MAKRRTRELTREAFREVIGNSPSRVKQVKRKQGAKAAKRMAVAIALDKARRAGARIPKARS